MRSAARAPRTDAVILSQPLKAHHYEAQPLRLPASAWSKLTPQSELYLAVTCTDERTRAKTEIQERVRLFGPVFTTMLATDKPTYRPGETLFSARSRSIGLHSGRRIGNRSSSSSSSNAIRPCGSAGANWPKAGPTSSGWLVAKWNPYS